jgi:hypothetical protein
MNMNKTIQRLQTPFTGGLQPVLQLSNQQRKVMLRSTSSFIEDTVDVRNIQTLLIVNNPLAPKVEW